MKTNNSVKTEMPDYALQAQPLINRFIKDAQTTFSSRIQAIYKIGSLGSHGDFSPCSDVDIALFLDEVKDTDFEKVKHLWDTLKQSGLPYADRLSVFWTGTLQQFKQGVGRFPALDRLDLLQHGILLKGNDVRSQLTAPSPQEIIAESAAFIKSFMLTPEKEKELKHHPEVILQKGARYFSKFVLFPVRLIFTLDYPNDIGSNRDAVKHYYASWHEKVPAAYPLIQFAYEARQKPADQPVDYDPKALQNALLPLYHYCVQKYEETSCPT